MNLAPVFSHPDSPRQELPAPCVEALMRVRLALFGAEVLDFTIGPEQTAEDEWIDCGTTASTPVGFTRAEVPWEDSGSAHQFDPE